MICFIIRLFQNFLMKIQTIKKNLMNYLILYISLNKIKTRFSVV